MDSGAEYIPVKEFAKLVSASPSMIYGMVQRSEIPFLRLGRRGIRIPRAHAKEMIQEPANAIKQTPKRERPAVTVEQAVAYLERYARAGR